MRSRTSPRWTGRASRCSPPRLDDLFQRFGYENECRKLKCCRNMVDGGGIPNVPATVGGVPVYECYVPIITTAPTTTTTTTTTICDTVLLTDPDDHDWSAKQLIDAGLGCVNIAFALGGVFDLADGAAFTGSDKDLSELSFYPVRPPSAELFDLALQCGCVDTCLEWCNGCNSLNEALRLANFDTTSYFCADIEEDFNLDCSGCGCRTPDDCDAAVLFTSANSKSINPDLYDISCNQLSALGRSCQEIALYTAFHNIAGTCDTCGCDATTAAPFCDQPCGGGQFGGNSSSGVLGTEEILSCNDLVAADFSCEEAVEIGCTGCESCGCQAITTTTVVVETGCNVDCNDLYLSCNDLVLHFTCDELQHSIFDGCGCGDCGCVEEFIQPLTCGNSCLENMPCDYWIDTEMSNRKFYTCQNLEDSYGCDCSGCECASTNITITPPSCDTGTGCLEMPCDIVSVASGFTFFELEELFQCDCTGCPSCDPAAARAPPATTGRRSSATCPAAASSPARPSSPSSTAIATPAAATPSPPRPLRWIPTRAASPPAFSSPPTSPCPPQSPATTCACRRPRSRAPTSRPSTPATARAASARTCPTTSGRLFVQ